MDFLYCLPGDRGGPRSYQISPPCGYPPPSKTEQPQPPSPPLLPSHTPQMPTPGFGNSERVPWSGPSRTPESPLASFAPDG